VPDRWQAYAAAQVDIELERGAFTCVPGPPAPLPPELDVPLWIITAHNPGPSKLSDEENASRHAALFAMVVEMKLRHWPAVGRNPEGTWREASLAIAGIPFETAREIARAFDQDAVFRLDAHGLVVVPVAPQAVPDSERP
jgi:hypothetical protein